MRMRHLPPPGPAPIDMLRRPGSAFLIQYVAAKNKVPVKVILGREQTPRAVAARHEAIRVVYTHTSLTSSQIGRAVCRHHATVLYALGRESLSPKKIRVERQEERRFRRESLERRLQWTPRAISAAIQHHDIIGGPNGWSAIHNTQERRSALAMDR